MRRNCWWSKIEGLWIQLQDSETGQGLVEYSLIIGFVALSSAALMTQSGSGISGIWSGTNQALQTQSSTPSSGGSGTGTSGSGGTNLVNLNGNANGNLNRIGNNNNNNFGNNNYNKFGNNNFGRGDGNGNRNGHGGGGRNFGR